jgi:hypothetical protein
MNPFQGVFKQANRGHLRVSMLKSPEKIRLAGPVPICTLERLGG